MRYYKFETSGAGLLLKLLINKRVVSEREIRKSTRLTKETLNETYKHLVSIGFDIKRKRFRPWIEPTKHKNISVKKGGHRKMYRDLVIYYI
jgi:hypothetical protein